MATSYSYLRDLDEALRANFTDVVDRYQRTHEAAAGPWVRDALREHVNKYVNAVEEYLATQQSCWDSWRTAGPNAHNQAQLDSAKAEVDYLETDAKNALKELSRMATTLLTRWNTASADHDVLAARAVPEAVSHLAADPADKSRKDALAAAQKDALMFKHAEEMFMKRFYKEMDLDAAPDWTFEFALKAKVVCCAKQYRPLILYRCRALNKRRL